jgi:hypothetical protein
MNILFTFINKITLQNLLNYYKITLPVAAVAGLEPKTWINKAIVLPQTKIFSTKIMN